jgi:hypothetical protein
MYVATAMVVIALEADSDFLKKAVRGFKNSEEQIPRPTGTGVVGVYRWDSPTSVKHRDGTGSVVYVACSHFKAMTPF